MTINYTWEVTSMKVVDTADLQNVVVQTYWKKTGTDENGNTGVFSGATPLSVKTVNPENFTPYNELTQQIVIQWIQETLKDETHINEQIEKQINLHKNPVVEKSLPWASDNTESSYTI